ncbi:MAG: hypothetical protein R3D33_05860 [Hyphomicrobiaceae bacterium]
MIGRGIAYGLTMFGLGALCGTARELALAPLLGRGPATWLEFVIMLALTIVVGQRFSRRASARWLARLGMGLSGVLVLVALESSLALLVLETPLHAYLATYDLAAGALFPWGLLVMLLTPVILRPPAKA